MSGSKGRHLLHRAALLLCLAMNFAAPGHSELLLADECAPGGEPADGGCQCCKGDQHGGAPAAFGHGG